MTPEIWTRKCQSCNHIQSAKIPDSNKELTNSYLNSKCRKCRSEDLDYGRFRYLVDGKFVNEDPLDTNDDE